MTTEHASAGGWPGHRRSPLLRHPSCYPCVIPTNSFEVAGAYNCLKRLADPTRFERRPRLRGESNGPGSHDPKAPPSTPLLHEGHHASSICAVPLARIASSLVHHHSPTFRDGLLGKVLGKVMPGKVHSSARPHTVYARFDGSEKHRHRISRDEPLAPLQRFPSLSCQCPSSPARHGIPKPPDKGFLNNSMDYDGAGAQN